jgi:hypothetical protein
VKLARLRKPKATCSPSYVNYRHKTNTAVLLDTGYTKGRLHMRVVGKGKATKNLNVVDVLSVGE